MHLIDDIVKVALLRVELVDEEDDRLLELISITEIVLRSYFGTILAVDKDDGEVSDIECSNGTSYEVIRP